MSTLHWSSLGNWEPDETGRLRRGHTAVRALSDPISPLTDLRSSVLIPSKSVLDLLVKSLMVWHGSVPANLRLRRLYVEKYGEPPVDILNKKLIMWVISALNSSIICYIYRILVCLSACLHHFQERKFPGKLRIFLPLFIPSGCNIVHYFCKHGTECIEILCTYIYCRTLYSDDQF
jgi:hypothetical protein